MTQRVLALKLVTLALLMLLVLPAAAADRVRNVEPGNPLPTFQRAGLDGESITFERNSGDVLVLVYLSAHQTQSERAMKAAHAVVKDIASSDLRLVYMTADVVQLGYFREIRKEGEITEPLALDEGHLTYGELGLIVFPTTVVSSREGDLLHVLSGWTRDYEYQLEAYCRHAMGELDGVALADRLKRSPQAIDEARARADRHRAAAAVLRSKGMLADAARELKAALAANPASAAAIVDLADVLVAQGHVDEAEERIKALVAQSPDVQGVRLVQGLIHLKRRELEQAERMLRDSLLMNPDPTRAHYFLGRLYEQKGQYKDAMEHYREALKKVMKEPVEFLP
ncbi:MAG: tetratricopeptide repeat protein [Phycisphaerales bacterium]|nr:MAG: tetratricopeptide repeat protein [Phycisphaerales bacterium]